MDEARCRARLSAARDRPPRHGAPDGRPHVVACCFAVQGDRLWTAVDAKPKDHPRLQRLDNVARSPVGEPARRPLRGGLGRAVVGARGRARRRCSASGEEHEAALAALVAKYAQYAAAPPRGPVIAVAVERWRGVVGAG
jgi:hypothetical protein